MLDERELEDAPKLPAAASDRRTQMTSKSTQQFFFDAGTRKVLRPRMRLGARGRPLARRCPRSASGFARPAS
jgi:hypothetical protein